jgi:hypothetical protein
VSKVAADQITFPTGNVLWVDKNGNDGEGARGKGALPFLTIQAAINAAVAGDLVLVRPGTYSEVITCKDGVSVRGLDQRTCVISYTGAATATVVTLAESMHFSGFRMALSPSAGVTTGISMPATTNATSMVQQIRQAASPTGSGSVRGFVISGTGVGTPEHRAVEYSVLMGAGAAQSAVEVTGTGTSFLKSSVFAGGTGIGLKVGAGTTVHCTLNRCTGTVRGIDVAATASLTIDLGTTYNEILNLGTLYRDQNVYGRSNFTAVVGPTTSDDTTKGYAPGSFWLDTVSGTLYTCASAEAGTAFWSFIQTPNNDVGDDRPGEFFLGDLLSYAGSANQTASEIQYARVWLTAGIALKAMVFFQDAGGNPARDVRMGLYSQTTPTDTAGVPVTRVAQTANWDTQAADNGKFVRVVLTADYTITVSGYYWIALITDSTSLSFASTAVARTNLWPVRRETGATTVLPATAGTLSNPTSALLYCAASET